MEKILLDRDIQKTAEELNKQKKIRIRIPNNQLNPDDIYVPVCINGYSMIFNRGESIEVPESVAELLAGAGYI